MTPKFFKTPDDFRRWLERNYDSASELLVGFYKKHTGRPSIDWDGAVDQALCFGWIDGIRRRIDDDTYQIRFTPRRPGSMWSEKNIRRVAELQRAGVMHQSGLTVFKSRDKQESKRQSEKLKVSELGPPYDRAFKKHKRAYTFFQDQPPSYRKAVCAWVMSARKEETRQRRLATVIENSKNRKRLNLLSPKVK